MDGSLCLSEGVLWVARPDAPARLQAYDLDGRALAAGFELPRAERIEPRGLAVDADRRLWLADARGHGVWAWSVFGRPLLRLSDASAEWIDRPGQLGEVVDVETRGVEDELEILVASAGWRRHGLQCLRTDGTVLDSLRPLGDPAGQFRGLGALAVQGETLYACEPRAGRIQVFRGRSFHYALELPRNGGGMLEPRALAPLADGRLVVVTGGERSAVLLLDASAKRLATLADEGEGEGRVLEPSDVVVEEGADDRHTRVAVVDLAGERIQVFNLEGTCYGAFER